MKSLLKHLGSARDKRNSGSNDTRIKFLNIGKGPVCTYLQKNGQLILHDELLSENSSVVQNTKTGEVWVVK